MTALGWTVVVGVTVLVMTKSAALKVTWWSVAVEALLGLPAKS